ncbi:MAG: hypothetical protein JNM39_15450 [Bdellovibrionaceae bacterium]|nr:hypothetical protein [Pseudobdellovibrionaceae bacterium]
MKIYLSILLLLSFVHAPVSADVMPLKKDDLYVLKVVQVSDTQRIHFQLCEFSTENLQEPKGCIGIGKANGYTEKQLKDQRLIEKWEAGGLWVGGAALVAIGGWVGIGLGAGAVAGMGFGFVADAVVIVGSATAGGGAAAAGVYVSSSINPIEQSKDVRVLEDRVIQDEEVLVFEGSTVSEFAHRLEQVLKKIRN